MRRFSRIYYEPESLPFLTVSIHSGHDLRPSVAKITSLNEEQRLREEDPFTDNFAGISKNRIIVFRSRFEVDLNRARDKAVYLIADEAWGLKPWKVKPDKRIINKSLQLYDKFYDNINALIGALNEKNGYSLIYDLHSFNYKREQYDGNENLPDIIVGTGKIDRKRWRPAINKLIKILQTFDFQGRRLQVAENGIFPGGNFPHKIATMFPQKSCVLSLEFKKFFMNEKTGKPFGEQINYIKRLLEATITPVQEAVKKIVVN